MRRPNLLRFMLVASFGLLVGHGIAAAQAQGTPLRPPAFPDITAGLTRQVNLTPAEQLVLINETVSKLAIDQQAIWRDLRGILAEDYGVRPQEIAWTTFEDAHVSEAQDPAWCTRAPAGASISVAGLPRGSRTILGFCPSTKASS